MGCDFIFEASCFKRNEEVYLAARLEGMDCIVTFFRPKAGSGARGALKGAEATLIVEGKEVGVKISPATYENMLALDRQVAPQRKLVALNKRGVCSGLGTGNRVIIAWDDVPKLRHPGALGVFEGIFKAVQEPGTPNWFIQQSIVRELIPEGADPEEHPGIGHTGGYGPRELLRSGLFAFFAMGGYVERRSRGARGQGSERAGEPRSTHAPMHPCTHAPPLAADADHAIVTGENEQELAESLALNKLAIAESRDYTKFTVDTSRLFGFPVELSEGELTKLHAAFSGRKFEAPNILPGRPGFSYSFDEEEIARLGRKYWRALQVHKELYDFIAELKGDEPFDYELSLDETEEPTEPEELLFYLVALEEVMGLPKGGVTSVAPNFGFRKRSDYEGSLDGLKALVNECASVAASRGVVICFHSGSGKGVETGKGPGVDEALREATGGQLQLKVSGILQEILWRVLAESDVPEERALFEEAWDETKRVVGVLSAVYDRLIAGREEKEALALLGDEALVAEVAGKEGVHLVKGVLSYGLGRAKLAKELLATADSSNKRPSDDFFRHFAYLVFRPLRERIYRTMTRGTWQRYAEAVRRYIVMRTAALGLSVSH
jgi:hypothetical protein